MTIYILALHGVATGGPEATHQLSDALLAQGFDARLVYFKWEDFKAGIPAAFPERAGFAPEYERYQVKLARALPDEEGSVIVIPESACFLAQAFERAKVLVWWLSVDNAFGALSRINLNYLRRPNVYHASQSRYAERFCEALQFNHIGMLSDYTVDLTEYAEPLPMSERPKIAAFNARQSKVIADLPAIGEEIAKLDPEIRCVAIVNLTRPEIAAVFAQARVYVDLGNFPGKDRLPREAARMGCEVIVGSPAGASGEVAATYVDLAMTPLHMANGIAMTMGSGGVVASPANERSTFNTEVRNIFTTLGEPHDQEAHA